jgi:hypothetical protein
VLFLVDFLLIFPSTSSNHQSDVRGLGPEEMERNVMYGLEGTVQNRWMDKWNIIVTADGQVLWLWELGWLWGFVLLLLLLLLLSVYPLIAHMLNTTAHNHWPFRSPRLLHLGASFDSSFAMLRVKRCVTSGGYELGTLFAGRTHHDGVLRTRRS